MEDSLKNLHWRLEMFGHKLTERERLMLVLITHGYSIGQTAKLLRRQPMRVKNEVGKAISKLY